MPPFFIYEFKHNDQNYIGSTTDFVCRMAAHKQHRKQSKYSHLNIYRYLNDNNIQNMIDFTEIIFFTDEEKTDIQRRMVEQNYIDTRKPTLNMYRALRKQKNNQSSENN